MFRLVAILLLLVASTAKAEWQQVLTREWTQEAVPRDQWVVYPVQRTVTLSRGNVATYSHWTIGAQTTFTYVWRERVYYQWVWIAPLSGR